MSEQTTRATASGDTVSNGVLRITEVARGMVLGIRSGEENPESLALWLEINGSDRGSYTYDMWFQLASDAGNGDAVTVDGELTVVVAASSVDRMKGATLDVGDSGGEQGLVMLNPNTPKPEGGPAVPADLPGTDLSGEIPRRILEVLERDVNPQIATHGGWADLVAFDEGTAYVSMLGGCQGCGLASMTLTQGIAVAIQDQVPEVLSVVDVTDHASGSNPYYEASKK